MKPAASRRLIALVPAWLCLAAASITSTAGSDYLITFTDLTPPSAVGGGLSFASDNWLGGSVDGDAAIWIGPSHSLVNLHPAGATYSEIMGGAGTQQVGYTYSVSAWASYAALWNGTVASYRNLNPSWASASWALATTGTQQVGYATGPGFQDRAGVWSGTAASFIDLHPVGGDNSMAYAIAGNQQGGMVSFNGYAHAALWSGTAASFRDLNPSGQKNSEIRAMTLNQQVGYAGTHAGIWFGTPESFIDLNPAGATFSVAAATIDTMQAGYATIDSHSHAILWFGAADNYIDLQLELGAQYRESEAYSVWSDGSTILVAGGAWDWPGAAHPMLWSIEVPEPATGSFLALTLGVLVVSKRCKRNWVR